MTALRIRSWNVDGLATWLARPGALREHVEAWGGADVLCLQEVRLRPADAALVASCERALGDDWVAQWSLNRDPHNGRFRGGRTYGVVTWARRALAPRALPGLPWDVEGRVTRTELAGLVVANVYAVNGTFRPHFDPATGAPDGVRHGWKRRFVEMLHDALAPSRGRLVAIGDWNVSPAAIDVHPRLRTEEPHATARTRFRERFVEELDLVDVFRALHPTARAYTWRDRRAEARGALDAARVDYALVSSPLVPRVLRAEILEDEAARAGSDHAPLVLDLRA